MTKAVMKNHEFEENLELERKIIVGDIFLTEYRKHGLYHRLVDMIEPRLDKKQRKLFGLFF